MSVAYDLKEDLRQFWNQRSKPAVEKFLDACCRRADASGSQTEIAAKIIENKADYLLSLKDNHLKFNQAVQKYMRWNNPAQLPDSNRATESLQHTTLNTVARSNVLIITWQCRKTCFDPRPE